MQSEPIRTVKVAMPPKREPTIEEMAAERAASDPLPGPLAQAFMTDSIEIAGVSVRKIVASDYVTFKFLNSPILRQLLELAKPQEAREEIISEDFEEWEMVWQFVNDPRRVREARCKGREYFRKLAEEEISDRFTSEQVRLIMLAIFEQVKRSAETSAKFVAEAKEKGEITFFREPK